MSLVISKVFTYDTDAGNYIQAVEAADQADTPGIGALEPAVRQAINNFVIGCKQDGIWDAIKVGCILAGAKTLEGSFIDLKSATKILTNNNFADGTYVGSNYTTGDYNRKTGLVGNGSTKYLNSNRNNNTDPQNSFHVSAYMSNVGTSGYALGCGSGEAGYFLMGTTLATSAQANRSNSDYNLTSTPTVGLIGQSRFSASTFTIRHSGSNLDVSRTSQTPANLSILVYCRGTPASPAVYSNARLAFYSIGEAIDLAKLDSRVTDLINAFGAAIP